METLIDALSAAMRGDAGRPLVTFYDLATGERIELSVATFDNWTAKIANLLGDELGREPGERIAVHLPTHWQSTVLMVGAWRVGMVLELSGASADVTVVGPAPPPGTDTSSGDVIVCSLRPLGGPALDPLPDGWLDFAVEVPPQPDVLVQPVQVTSVDPAAASLSGLVSHGELLEQAITTAGELGLPTGGRLITDANPARASGMLPALAAPLAVGGSVVIVANSSPDQRARLADQERAATALWLTSPQQP
ncbi:MAG TPA: TIGR03089 family protein [Nocardioidaceae bacterium]|nr:TIGR03089 family protein [Nocardioidaceae bacterium]